MYFFSIDKKTIRYCQICYTRLVTLRWFDWIKSLQKKMLNAKWVSWEALNHKPYFVIPWYKTASARANERARQRYRIPSTYHFQSLNPNWTEEVVGRGYFFGVFMKIEFPLCILHIKYIKKSGNFLSHSFERLVLGVNYNSSFPRWP